MLNDRLNSKGLSKRERLERTLAGEEVDRPPACLWRYWPGDDQRPVDFAQALVDFQRAYDWDFVIVPPDDSFLIADYGTRDHWQGAVDGRRAHLSHTITRPANWIDLHLLDPGRGALARQIEALHLLREELGEDVPYIQTIPSPLSQAAGLAGWPALREHLRRHPTQLQDAVNTFTDNTLRFIDALRRTRIDGIFYIIDHADYALLSREEYEKFGRPYDLRILTDLPGSLWLNAVHLRGELPMFDVFVNYPVRMLSWERFGTGENLIEGKLSMPKALFGGISRAVLNTGSPAEVRAQARETLLKMGARPMALSTGGASLLTTPLSNLRAAREAAER
jgi:uroporphyrinogen decarboxylase